MYNIKTYIYRIYIAFAPELLDGFLCKILGNHSFLRLLLVFDQSSPGLDPGWTNYRLQRDPSLEKFLLHAASAANHLYRYARGKKYCCCLFHSEVIFYLHLWHLFGHCHLTHIHAIQILGIFMWLIISCAPALCNLYFYNETMLIL